MVSDFIAGAIISGVFALVGSLGTSYLNMHQTQLEQQKEDRRIVAQSLAESEIETLKELNHQTNRCHRIYTEGVKHATSQIITEQEYREDIRDKFRDLQEVKEKGSLFMSDKGDELYRVYLNHLMKADSYIRKKSEESEEDLDLRKGDTAELLMEDDADLDWEQWQLDHQFAVESLKDETDERLGLLEPFDE